MTLAVLLAYVAAVLVLFIVPGPAVMITLSRALQGGAPAGIVTGAGIAVADALHATFAIVGLSAVLLASATAFQVVKYAGVLYLVYLGVRALLAREATTSPDQPDAKTPAAGGLGGLGATFWQGFFSELLNPKTALFFLAFLPQFTDPTRGSLTLQLSVLGGIFVLMSIAYTTLLSLLAAPLASRLERGGGSLWQQRIVGVVYLIVAAQVARA